MNIRRLTEASVELTLELIKQNIATALGTVRAYYGDSFTVEPPPTQSYFIYEKALAYKCPAVFVMCDAFQFNTKQTGPNFIDATAKLNVSVVIEDKEMDKLTPKAWRYQSALHQILNQAIIETSDQKVRLDIVVINNTFSPIYSNTKKPGQGPVMFRKEVVVECDVYHKESL